MTDKQSTFAQRHTDRWFGLGFVAFAGLLYSINWQWSAEPTLGDPGPLLLPNIMAVLIALLGLRLMVKPTPPVVDPEAEPQPEGPLRLWRGAGACAGLLAYVLVLPYLGYLLSTGLFFAATTWLLGQLKLTSALVCVLIAIAVALGSDYLLAEVLNISLPEGELLRTLKESLNV